jgi:hypothetical protein
MALLCLLMAGCTPGFIYTHQTEPLALNFRTTPSGRNAAKGDVKHFSYYVDVRWDKNGIGEIARKNDIEEIYYADLETFSVLGIWQQRWVHVYGK